MLKPFHINEAVATSQLRILADQMMTTHTRDLFQTDAQRFDRFHLTTGGLTFDYSKQRINDEVINGLVKLAEEADLKGAIESMFTG